MAAILKLRRGTTTDLSGISLQISELYYNTSKKIIQVGDGVSNITLVKLGEQNTGSLHLSGDLTASNAQLSGDIRINGNIYLGDTLSNDNIQIQASLSGSLIPSASNEYDLGSTSKLWKNAYITSASILDISLPASNIVSSSIQIDHDATTNFVSNEHINHANVSILAGNGMSGGGTIASTRTLTLDTSSSTFTNGVKSKLNADGVISGSSQLDNVFLEINGDGVFSSSLQVVLNDADKTGFDTSDVSEGTRLYYTDARVKTKLNTENVISSSVQVNADTITNFDTNVKTKLNTENVISSSVQVNADTITNFDSNVKDKMNSDGVLSGSSQLDSVFLEIDGDSVVSSSAQISGYNKFLEISGDSVVSSSEQISLYNKFLEIGGDNVISSSAQLTTTFDSRYLNTTGDSVVSSSQQIDDLGFLKVQGDNVVSQSQQINIDQVSGYTSYSSSIDLRLDNIEGGFSTSLDSRLDVLEGPFSTSVDSRLDTIEGAFSTSVDTRIDSLEATTHTHANKANLDTINQNLATTNNVTFADGDFTGDVQVTGNLTVLGSATEIQTSELRIADKLITVASGSADSAASDGAGLEVAGANKSLKWDHNTTSFVLDAKVSSSVGFKGDGSELTGVTAASVDYPNITNKPTLVSGSSQVSASVYSGVSGDIAISSAGVSSIVGGSIINSDVNNTAGIKFTKLDFDNSGHVSSSAQISNYVKFLEIDGDSVVSSSAQISAYNKFLEAGGDSVVSSSAQISNYVKFLEINGDNVISSSAQLTPTFDVRYINSSGDGVISGSSQVTQSLDTRYEPIASVTNTLVSESRQISGSIFTQASGDVTFAADGVADIGSEVITNGDISPSAAIDFNKINYDRSNIVSSSEQISGITNSQLGSSAITIAGTSTSLGGSITATTILEGTSVVSGSSQVTQSLDTRYLEINGDGVVSQSAQLQGNYDLRYEPIASNANKLISSSVLTSTTQGRAILTTNGAQSDVGITNLLTTSAPSFVSASFTGLQTAGSSVVNALFVDSNKTKVRALGTAAFLNTSASIGDDPNSIPTTKAVNDALISAGAGDITEVNPTNTFNPNKTGLIHLSSGTDVGGVRGVQGNIHLQVATGSTNFTEGVTKALPGGLVSSSEQIDNNFFDIDGLVSSSAQISNFNKFLEIDGDSVVSESAQITGISNSQVATNAAIASSKIDYDSSNIISSSAQLTTTFDARYINTTGDGVHSGSSQVNTAIAGTSFSSSIDSRVVNLEVASNENPLTFNDTATIDLTRNTNTITAKAIGGIVSSSAQISGYTKFLEIDGDNVISSSAQLTTDFDTRYLNTGGDDIVSSSGQIRAKDTNQWVGDFKDGLNDNTVISASAQLYTDLDARYATDLGEGIISSSIQIDHDSTTNFVANEHIDHSSITIGSGKGLSGGGTIDTNRSLSLDSGSAHFLEGVKKKLNTETVISQSAQVDASSVANFDSNILTYINDRGVHSSSLQVVLNDANKTGFDTADVAEGTNLYYTDVRVKTKLNTEGVISGSSFMSPSQGTLRPTINGTALSDVDLGLQSGDSPTFTNLVLTGNLTVQGTETKLNTAELSIEDKLISVASGSTNSSQANGAGLHISGADESITWDHANSRFNISDDIYAVGTIKASDDIIAYASSDKQLKNNIQPIENPIEKINQISGNSFVWNEEKQNIYSGKDYGVIAQEIEAVLPELVNTRDNGYKAVKYDKLVSLLIEGIKELSNEVNELKKKVK